MYGTVVLLFSLTTSACVPEKKKLQAIGGAANFMIFESFYQQRNMLEN